MPAPARVLLVDDDPDFLEMERAIFEGEGYEVTGFSDPKAALAALEAAAEAERPGLVVCDLMMRALDSGFSFAGALKADQRFCRIPIIIVSAIASQKGFDFHPRTAEDLAAMHAEAFFDKPVQPRALIARAQELLA